MTVSQIAHRCRELITTYRVDLFNLLLLLFFSFFVWWPTRYLPFSWDSAGFYANAVNDLVSSGFSPLIAGHSDFAHPPLLIVISALLWQIFSGSLVAQHLLMFPFLPLFLLSTYLIGRHLVSPLFGIMAAVLLGVLPVTLTEAGSIYLDLPAAAFVTTAIMLWLYRRYSLSLLFLAMAFLTKETSVLILPLFFLLNLSQPQPLRRRFNLLLAITLLPVSLYLVYHYQVTGWLLVRPEAQLPHRLIASIAEALHSARVIATSAAVDHARWLLFIPATVAFVYVYVKERQLFTTSSGRIVSLFLLELLLGFLFFVTVAEFAPRYGLFLYPLAILSALYGLYTLIGLLVPSTSSTLFVLYSLGVIVAFILNWYPPAQALHAYDFRPPDDLSYLDLITINRQLAAYLTAHEPESQVFGAFPENIYLTQPFQGYVSRTVDFALCEQFAYDQDRRQLVIIHAYSPGTLNCRQISTVYPFAPLTRFESGTRWLELYQVTATPSAQTQSS